MVSESYDVITIGGGAAGGMAAAYVAGNKYSCLLLDKAAEEGFLASLGDAGAFSPFPDGTSGTEIIERLRNRAASAGCSIKQEEASEIDAHDKIFKVKTAGATYSGRALVLAMGGAVRTGYLHGEKELLGRGVFYDASSFAQCAKGKEVAIIGKGKVAAEEALMLTKFAEKIFFIVPSNKLDVENRIFSQIQKSGKIELLFSTSLKTINGKDQVDSVTVFTGGQEKELPVKSVFTYMHDYQPKNQFLKGVVEISPNGQVMVNEQFQTSVPGVFACGDILCQKPQFPAISLAQGLLAGINVSRYLLTSA